MKEVVSELILEARALELCLYRRPLLLIATRGLVASLDLFPTWTLFPFVVLVLGIASFPLMIPNLWGRHSFQIFVSLLCTAPVA